jgi:Rrf2 family protein
MKISTKGRYGLQALVDLASIGGTEPVALRQIADRQGISEGYLEQVFSQLRKTGLILSIKGPHGGYLLAQPADQISIGSILTLLEGDLSVVEVGNHSENNIVAKCLQKMVWSRIDESVRLAVDSVVLQDLVEHLETMTHTEIGNYCI